MRLVLRVALLALLALTLWSIPTRAAAAHPGSAPDIYIVQPGDTLYSIALRHQTTVAELKQLNNLKGDIIVVGQKLLVPSHNNAAPTSSSSASYTVQPGDSLYRIALRYGTTVRALEQFNDISNRNLISVGQTLAVPNSNTLAKPGLSVDPLVARQGGTLLVQVSRPNLTAVSGSFGAQTLSFVRSAGYFYALVPISRCAKLGSATLAITATDLAGEPVTESVAINIAATAFTVQKITLPPGKAELLEPTLVKREAEQLAAIVAHYTPTRLWNGAFRQPMYSAITSDFGTRRSYNGGPVGACGHEGTDFDADNGDPVYADARGRVVFAAPTQVRGNLIVVDHGLGVFSGFYHLSEIKVQAGQIVELGELIGKAGTTGLSTGPHLHWSMFVNGEYVDPMEWTRRRIP